MWKAQEKLPKSASHPRGGKSSIRRPLLWQNWEADPGVLALSPRPAFPSLVWHSKGLLSSSEPHRWVGASFPPSLTLGLGCFFPGAVVGPSLCDAGLWVASATGAWGCRLGVNPITGPFWDVCPGAGDPACQGPARMMEMQNQRVPCWCTHGTGCRVGMQVPGIGVSPQGCSIAAPLHCTAGLLLSVLLITNHGDKVGAV